MTTLITDATALAWFDQFHVIAGNRLCPEMSLIFADFLQSEHGLDSWAECLRWMVAKGKWPWRGYLIDWYWISSESKEMDEFSDCLPVDLIALIGEDPEAQGCSIDFISPQAAFLAPMKVWHQREDKP